MSKIEYKDDTLAVENLDVGGIHSSIDNGEFAEVHKNSDGVVLYGVKRDGSFFWNKGIPEHIKKYVSEHNTNKEVRLMPFTTDNLCYFKCSDTENSWNGTNSMLLFSPADGKESTRHYYRRLHDYLNIITSYGVSIVRFITHRFTFSDANPDLTIPDYDAAGYFNTNYSSHTILEQFDTVFYYLAKNNIDIVLTTDMLYTGTDPNGVTNWDPVFEKIAILANRYDGRTDIRPKDDANATPIKVIVKYWEFCNEMGNKQTGTQTQLYLQKRYYTLLKGINENFKVLSYGYSSSGNDSALFENEEYHNYFDIWNFHCHKGNLNDFVAWFNYKRKSNPYPLEKEFWLTEYGVIASYIKEVESVPDKERLNNLIVEKALIALSYGASRCLFWVNELLITKEIGDYIGESSVSTDDTGLPILTIGNVEVPYYRYYLAIKNLHSLHDDGSTKPVLEYNNGVYSIRWINSVGKKYTALFANEEINVDVVVNQSSHVYDCMLNEIEKPIKKIDTNIIYVEDSDNVILKFE